MGQAGAGPGSGQGDSAIDPGVIKRMLIKCADIRDAMNRECLGLQLKSKPN